MILFIVVAVGILWYTLSGSDGLIAKLIEVKKYKYPVRKALSCISDTIFYNIAFNTIGWLCVIVVSMLLGIILHTTCPQETSHWEFNINALQDNMGIEGRLRYAGRGYINDSLSYYYSRTMPQGEIIERIPANNTYVRYSNTEKPHVEVHQTQTDIPEWLCKVFFLKWMNEKRTEYYVIVAPEGTITTTGQYEIDMR